MSEGLFKCLECGICCRDILDDIKGDKRGLTLTAEEALLFPQGLIAPLMAIGMENPETVILYQLKANDCPYVNQNNKCMIYEKRPLVCRAFPLSQGAYSTKCRLFRFAKNFPEGFVKIAIDWGNTQLDAERKLDKHIIEHFKNAFKKGIGVWSFDLASEQWKLKMRCEKEDDTIEF